MKHKKWICLALASLLSLSMLGLAACGEGDDSDKDKDQDQSQDQTQTDDKNKDSLVPTQKYSFPIDDGGRTSTGVSVHDPSIFYDEASKTYFAFGTHYAVASSPDLVEWTQEVSDGQWHAATSNNNFNFKLYDEANFVIYAGIQWPAALDDTLAIVQPTMNGSKTINTTWAPDVNYYNGKYYMYYSITKAFGSDKSAIGRVESDNVTGPYSNNTIIIESVTSTESGHPNCIDPELFYDKNGGLWMVYGSFFGGIYIKELYNSGENWGLPKEEEGWGTLLWRNGYSEGVEGPYIYYNELTDYYYLMVSEGDLNTVYNMRIARSKNPAGPYTDITGNDVATAEGRGNKVAGNYKFAEQGAAQGYAAMGHNSVIKDAQGRYFVIYHARRQAGATVTAGHNLMVSQLFFNEDGWPVMSPVAYVGEKAGLITQAEAAGEYDIVIHTPQTAVTMANSTKYTLTEDGKVQNGTAEAGTWTVKQDYYVEITIGGVTYKGVIVPGWDMYSPQAENQRPVFAITAVADLGDQGGSLWGISPRE